ncbi:MAG: hypothetical protein AUK43_01230 [Oscillatoriales cyanobacterium CG2_30_40_61]|nr:MAG: hypothetical protein AUK43_01230 [Oscillatoriales cyanobacterium CG2_30_40_61]
MRNKDRLFPDWRQNMIPNLRKLQQILGINQIIEKDEIDFYSFRSKYNFEQRCLFLTIHVQNT